ncbi:MAG: fumarylacetoacetate hydrolase family protein [Dehalococcoidales bacterium]|nr:fumarylacetoacetate hydrolase family protein [Dehalococcoidales bacterium]
MKIIRCAIGKKISYGVLTGKTIKAIRGNPFSTIRYSGATHKLNEVKLMAPCIPSKIVCLGLNYRSHANELKSQIPQTPLLFLKPTTAIIGPEDKIIYPEMSERVDYEGELGVVIKKKASHISQEEALDYVLGYTCFNDITARDLQNRDGQWTRAKGFDTFAAFGPCIETEVDPTNAPIETYLNGELKQRGNTDDLIFPVKETISFISNVMTLLPGDVIATGTPGGIGPMRPGDTVEIKIAPIGVLRNSLVKF